MGRVNNTVTSGWISPGQREFKEKKQNYIGLSNRYRKSEIIWGRIRLAKLQTRYIAVGKYHGYE